MVLLRIIGLNMHIMASYGTCNLFVSIKRQVLAVQSRCFTNPMTKIDAVALFAESNIILLEFPLARAQSKPATETRLRFHMAYLTIPFRAVGIQLCIK